jgi:hypothetical protein
LQEYLEDEDLLDHVQIRKSQSLFESLSLPLIAKAARGECVEIETLI